MLDQAKQQQDRAAQEVSEQVAEAQRIRELAVKEADEKRSQASKEAEERIAAVHRQSAMMKERIEEQYAWRKEQLQREIAALQQRKDATIDQLSNLKALAEQSKADFPNTDPFDDVEISATPTQESSDATSPESTRPDVHTDADKDSASDDAASSSSPDSPTTVIDPNAEETRVLKRPN